MKIRVRKDKEDKGEFRGLLLSFLLFLAAAAAFGAGSLGFLNRTGQKSGNTEKSHYKSLHTVLCH